MHRIYEVTRVCFDHALLLNQPEGVADVATLHRSAVDQVESTEAAARKAGFGAENARLIKYALVAFIDEVAQATPGPVADFWVDHLLQRDYFNEVRAGENFFVHLEKLLGARRDDEDALDVLQVYATCLFLGFRGKYVARSNERGFDELCRRVGDKLKDRLALEDGLPPPAEAEWKRPSRTSNIAVWIGAIALLFSVALLCGYESELSEDADALAGRLQEGVP
ncbi:MULTISPECIES: DotU family type IV/VI secretion system protein [unclassified Nannocystis]|uniref:DotU family type IV/VI secretion system protein n=1 Tax=Nannocystis TaxID=53 RepID=UPI002271AAAB|nr:MULTISPECIES: DotU family type IV/VI secretion system protein [unclassified Nannocystis]MCY0989638.1 DotU family type IV/VI secretion system protein [Nannocystis sp. ILAH1]MCY1071262.1 DotU family type IV/VI secretion system protein [Nannocystis sp. RBIL2]